MTRNPPSLQGSAVSRALLEIATLGHLWTGKGLKPGSAGILDQLRETNARDALVLQVVMTLLGEDDGPPIGTILKLPPFESQTLLTAPLAAKDPRLCQVWLALTSSHYELGSGHFELESALQEEENNA